MTCVLCPVADHRLSGWTLEATDAVVSFVSYASRSAAANSQVQVFDALESFCAAVPEASISNSQVTAIIEGIIAPSFGMTSNRAGHLPQSIDGDDNPFQESLAASFLWIGRLAIIRALGGAVESRNWLRLVVDSAVNGSR
eukprot:scaffold74728_cov33-Prasinocladus_malaysianus.AAC.4